MNRLTTVDWLWKSDPKVPLLSQFEFHLKGETGQKQMNSHQPSTLRRKRKGEGGKGGEEEGKYGFEEMGLVEK